jgi:hypothetical protein
MAVLRCDVLKWVVRQNHESWLHPRHTKRDVCYNAADGQPPEVQQHSDDHARAKGVDGHSAKVPGAGGRGGGLANRCLLLDPGHTCDPRDNRVPTAAATKSAVCPEHRHGRQDPVPTTNVPVVHREADDEVDAVAGRAHLVHVIHVLEGVVRELVAQQLERETHEQCSAK